MFQSTITEIKNFVLNKSTQLCSWNAFCFWLECFCVFFLFFFFLFCCFCDSLLSSLEAKFSFVHTPSEKWVFFKSTECWPNCLCSCQYEPYLCLWQSGFFLYVLFAVPSNWSSFKKKKAKVSVLETMLGRMNSTMCVHFSTGS